jgi:hypothetical protein
MPANRPISQIFEIPETDGENKVVSIGEAVRLAIRPGMTFFLGDGTNAFVRELIRQYRGTAPDFHLVTAGLQDFGVDLIHCALIKKATYLIGPGGANDAANAPDVLVVINQSKDRFVEKVPYTTSPGKNVSTVVSDKGIFERGDDNELLLTGYFGPGNRETLITEIREACGWELKVSPNPRLIPPPDPQSLDILRALDPEGVFTLG